MMSQTRRRKRSTYIGVAFLLTSVTYVNAAERWTSKDLLDVAHSYDAYGCKGMRKDIGWHVESHLQVGLQDESREVFDVWRLRVDSSLSSYCCESGNVQYAVRLTASPTIYEKRSEGCYVEKLIGARERTFTFKAGDLGKPSVFFCECRASLPNDGTAPITMCAYGKMPLHQEGATLEYALFFIGHGTLAFAYKMGCDTGVKNVCIPISDGWSSVSPTAEVGYGIRSVHDGRLTVSVAVERGATAKAGNVLFLTVYGSGVHVPFHIAVKNVLSLQECLRSQGKGMSCSWRAEVTKDDIAHLLF